MTDDITLIEKIQRNQTELAADLEALKQKEDAQYRADIEAIQERQAEFTAEIEALQNKIAQDKQTSKTGTAYILRTVNIKNEKQNIWIVFDKTQTLYGKAQESKESVLSRWAELFGKPGKLIAYTGLHRPSEAAMTILEIQEDENDAS